MIRQLYRIAMRKGGRGARAQDETGFARVGLQGCPLDSYTETQDLIVLKTKTKFCLNPRYLIAF